MAPRSIRVMLLAACGWSSALVAQGHGELDPGFGTLPPGISTFAHDLGGSNLDSALGAGVLSSRGYLVVGWSTLASGNALVFQYLLPDGTRDTSRPDDGRIVTAFSGSTYRSGPLVSPAAVVTLARSTFVAGRAAVAIDRFLGDGTPDTGFGVAGSVTVSHPTLDLQVNGLVPGANGSLVAYGHAKPAGAADTAYDPALYRIRADGNVDTSFSADGIAVFAINVLVRDELRAAAVLADGTVFACGHVQQGAGAGSHDLLVLQATPSGAPDAGFGGSGSLITDFSGPAESTDFCLGVAVGANGRRIALSERSQAGQLRTLQLVGYAAAGGIDATFGGNGNGLRDLPFPFEPIQGQLVLDGIGRPVVAASLEDPAGDTLYLARTRTSGVVDTSFGDAGTSVQQVAYVISATRRAYALKELLLDRERAVPVGDIEFSGNDRDWAIARLTADYLFGHGFE